MFEPVPGRYVWNLSAGIALSVGGQIGEVDRACRPLVGAAGQSEDEATQAFFASWCGIADTLVELAQEDEKVGRRHSAAQKYLRASVYYQTAERMQSRHFAPRLVAYDRVLDCFAHYLELGDEPAVRVEVPFGDASFPGIFVPGDTTGPAPCMIFFNGLDSTKEQFYGSGTPAELRRRGIATLTVDAPGSGEALRLRGMHAVPESERWASACVDYLETRADVDPDCIGILAWSLGGYYGPRAAAFEPRLKLCVAWGANYDWGHVQTMRLAEQGDRPVPHYWDHVQWVWGARDMDEFLRIAPRVTLRGILDRVRVPFLVIHGEHDRQIPLTYAHQTYDDLVNSPKRELKIFTDREGGVEHCSIDNMPIVRDYICDWIDETVRELRGPAPRPA